MAGLLNIPVSFRLSSASLAIGKARGKIEGAGLEINKAIAEIRAILEAAESDELESIEYQLSNLSNELSGFIEDLEEIRNTLKSIKGR